MNIATQVVKNSGIVFVGNLANKALNAVILIYLARYLGSSDFGKYSFVIAYLFFFSVIAMLGINRIVVREISQDKTLQGHIIGNALSIRLILSISAIVFSMIIVNLLGYPSDIKVLVYIYSLSLIFTSISATYATILEAKLKMVYSVLSDIVGVIVSLILIIFIIFFKGSIIHVMIALVVSSVFQLLTTLYFSQKFVKPRFEFNSFYSKRILNASILTGLTYFLWSIYYRIDVLMLSLMKAVEVVGYYSAAYTLVAAFEIFPKAIFTSFFPLMSESSKNSKELFEKIYETNFRLMGMIALPIAIFVTIFSKEIILLIYTDDFLQSSFALSILIWSIVFLFFNTLFANLLIAMGKEKMTAYITGILALVNIVLNYLLIPQYSYIGASIATVFAAFLGAIIYFYYIYIHIIKRLFAVIILKLIILNAIFYTILITFKFMPFVLLIAMSTGIYILLLVLSKCVTKEEVSLLKSIIGG